MSSFKRVNQSVFSVLVGILISQAAFAANFICFDSNNYGTPGAPKWHRQSGPWNNMNSSAVLQDAQRLALEMCNVSANGCSIKWASIDFNFCNSIVPDGPYRGNYMCAATARACGFSRY